MRPDRRPEADRGGVGGYFPRESKTWGTKKGPSMRPDRRPEADRGGVGGYFPRESKTWGIKKGPSTRPDRRAFALDKAQVLFGKNG